MKPGYTIVNHRLMGEGVVHLSCSKNTRRLEGPDMIVLHYTAGVSAASSADYLVRPEVKASAHLVIGRDGRIFQLVPFHVEAWHAGRSRYSGREGLNRFSIGIELDNLGRLRLEAGKFRAECNRIVAPEEVYADCSAGELSYWHAYTAVQVGVLERIVRLLRKHYPIRYVVGHSDITPRKSDPGLALKYVELFLNV